MVQTTIKLKQSKRRKRKRGEAKGRRATAVALSELATLLGDGPKRRDLLIEYLHVIQDRYGHITFDHCVALAEEMKISTSEIYETATFYHHFDLVGDDQTPPPPLTVRVCDSITCQMVGCEALIETLSRNLNADDVRIQRVPCVGRCEQAPIAVVGTNPIAKATTEHVTTAVRQKATEAPTITTHIGYKAYCEKGGYRLLKALHNGSRDAESVIQALDDSGLRGLGGAGFPSGRKWRIVKDYPAPRYLAINIDEGEPGTFKDRYYLEIDPHRFLEGMLIAAQVVGLDAIYIYLRDEYAGVRKMLTEELKLLQEHSKLPLPLIELRRGAGAYICGEESAMIESIEGKRGMPRLRPPFIAEVGLFGRPTLEHNMETLYWVRDIVEKGSEWFSSNGRNGRKGLRSFSVSGRVNKPGVHLTPAGITIKELIDEYCGGMQKGHTFYGYFPGGASGGILPATMGDIPLDFDTLNEYGCFIGSAAIIVFSDQDKARTVALNAMRFFSHESCGKCTPCRVGTSKAVRLMEKERWDVPLMNELSKVMADASICGLGQAAPNPLQCVIKYFPSEIE